MEACGSDSKVGIVWCVASHAVGGVWANAIHRQSECAADNNLGVEIPSV